MVDSEVQCGRCQGNGDTEQQSHLSFLPNCLGACTCTQFTSSSGMLGLTYTGLVSWKLFENILNFLMKPCPSLATLSANMLPSECLLLVLMHLRLSLQVQDLSYCFGLTVPRVCGVFQKWINAMFTCLKFLIIWPTHQFLQHQVHHHQNLFMQTCLRSLRTCTGAPDVSLIAPRSWLNICAPTRPEHRYMYILSTRDIIMLNFSSEIHQKVNLRLKELMSWHSVADLIG